MSGFGTRSAKRSTIGTTLVGLRAGNLSAVADTKNCSHVQGAEYSEIHRAQDDPHNHVIAECDILFVRTVNGRYPRNDGAPGSEPVVSSTLNHMFIGTYNNTTYDVQVIGLGKSVCDGVAKAGQGHLGNFKTTGIVRGLAWTRNTGPRTIRAFDSLITRLPTNDELKTKAGVGRHPEKFGKQVMVLESMTITARDIREHLAKTTLLSVITTQNGVVMRRTRPVISAEACGTTFGGLLPRAEGLANGIRRNVGVFTIEAYTNWETKLAIAACQAQRAVDAHAALIPLESHLIAPIDNLHTVIAPVNRVAVVDALHAYARQGAALVVDDGSGGCTIHGSQGAAATDIFRVLGGFPNGGGGGLQDGAQIIDALRVMSAPAVVGGGDNIRPSMTKVLTDVITYIVNEDTGDSVTRLRMLGVITLMCLDAMVTAAYRESVGMGRPIGERSVLINVLMGNAGIALNIADAGYDEIEKTNRRGLAAAVAISALSRSSLAMTFYATVKGQEGQYFGRAMLDALPQQDVMLIVGGNPGTN
jgi:hypothetical protein